MSTQSSSPSRTRVRSLHAKVMGLGRRLTPNGRAAAPGGDLARINRRAWSLLEAGRPALILGRPALAVARTRDRV